MRVAFFTDVFFPYTSGVATATDNLAYSLAKKDYKIVIFYPRHKGYETNKPKHGNIKLHAISDTVSFPAYKGFDIALPSIIKPLKILERFKPNIIHCVSEASIGWTGYFCSKSLNIPMVSTFHTFLAEPEYLKIVKLEKSKIAHSLLWSYITLFHNRSSIVICPSKALEKEAISHGLKKPTRVISNGLNLENFTTNYNFSELKKNTQWEE